MLKEEKRLAICEKYRRIVLAKIDMNEETTDEGLHQIIDEVIEEAQNEKYIPINDRISIHREIYDSIRGLGVLQELLEDDEITEIMVNGKDNIFIEKQGKVERYDGSFLTEEKLEDVIQQIVSWSNRRVNLTSPITDARLKDGSRVNVVLAPISLDGSAITIRKFPKDVITMDKLINWGSITKEAAEFLEKLVLEEYNVFVSGGTGSGKTTFLNVLSNYIPVSERIITIEDSAELQLQNKDNLVRLEVRQESVEGKNAVTIRDLIRASLRMRPDRIIVGEVRGEEALDMLQAMNTGHDGCMSTGHANSPKDMISRLESMVLMNSEIPLGSVTKQIASAVDIIVHLDRGKDGKRKVMYISEIGGVNKGEVIIKNLFQMESVNEKDVLVRTKMKLTGKHNKANYK